MTQRPEFDANRVATIVSLCLLASVTPSAVLLGPLIIGGLVTELGFSAQASGNMIFAELCGAACATFPAFYWIAHVDWRRVLTVALLVVIVSNLVSAYLGDPWLLGAARFVAGIGVGTIMSMTLIVSGMTRDQERVLSFWMMGQILFAAVALAAMPYMFAIIGIKGFYFCLAGVMAALLLPVRNMPRGGDASHRVRWRDLPRVTRRYAPIGLVGLLFFFVAMGGVWNFVERIGDAAGFDRRFISLTLSGVSAVGVLGAVSSAVVGLRWGRMVPFAIGIVTLAASMVLLDGVSSQGVFVASAFLFKFGWWFVSPYILANITTLDSSGKLITATGFVIPFGQALGPLVVGFLLPPTTAGSSSATDFSPAVTVGLACLALSCLLFVGVIRANHSRPPRDAVSADA